MPWLLQMCAVAVLVGLAGLFVAGLIATVYDWVRGGK